MSLQLNGTAGVTYNDGSNQPAAASPYGLKNRIINGNMVIDQRNAGASVTPANGNYTLDRWRAILTQSSKFTVQQNAGSITPPAGYSNYLGVTSSSAYSIISTDNFHIEQRIEGYNWADIGYGTADAKTVTLSFWVRSSLTGTFGGSFKNDGGGYSYPFSYTISSANTWEQKSITVAGATSGTWLGTNNNAVIINFGLGVGSTTSGTAGSWSANNYNSSTGATSVVGTSGATWYITGVQLEIGTTATPFENRMYGTELALCQRYYQKDNITFVGFMPSSSSNDRHINQNFITTMRATPTITGTWNTGTYGAISASVNGFSGFVSVGDTTSGRNFTAYTASAEL